MHLINIHLYLELKQHLSQHSVPQQLNALRHITWQYKQSSAWVIWFVVANTSQFVGLTNNTGEFAAAAGILSSFHSHFL